MKYLKIILLLVLIANSACKKDKDKIVPIIDDGDIQYATSALGMVSSAQPLATNAGLDILESGGNAADAALATAFVLAVVEPTMNGIGGRNQILVRKVDGTFLGYNGMTEIPASFIPPSTPVDAGHGTIAIPGSLAALMRLYKEHGSLPLEQIMSGSIKYAKEGFKILPGEATRHEMVYKEMLLNSAFRTQMLKNDSILYKAGEVLKQPDLANTLERILETEGQDFYHGDIAEKMVADMEANGGFVDLDDLKNYKALDSRLVSTTYRGYQINSSPAPTGGGLIVKTLNILEQFDLTTMNDAQWAVVINQALAIALNSMKTDYYEKDLSLVESKEWAKEQAQSISVPELTVNETAYTIRTIDENQIVSQTDWSGNTWGKYSHHTTHFDVADCNGMIVSITQTIGPIFGSKVITPGLGFVYASTMGSYLSNSDQVPGSRPRTTIAPTIITKDGEVIMAIGAAGGLRILSGIVQTISRRIDRKMTLKDAIAAPRVHPEIEVDKTSGKNIVFGKNMSVEFTPTNGWQIADSIVWANAGFTVNPIKKYGAFSRVSVIERDPETNIWIGVADPDWEGTAEGPLKSFCKN